MIEKVPQGTRMCAMFTYQSVAHSGKSADSTTGSHAERLGDKGSVKQPLESIHLFRFYGTKKRYFPWLRAYTEQSVRCIVKQS